MSEERDPFLDKLFTEAQQELADEGFTTQVMAQAETRRRRVLTGRLAVAVLLIALELLLDSPLQNSVGVFTDMLSTTLFEIRHEWLAFILGPANSIAGLVGVVLLGLHFAFRKIFY